LFPESMNMGIMIIAEDTSHKKGGKRKSMFKPE
jgi:hypothetical protein